MCGITGIFALGERDLPDGLTAANSSLTHRGPNDAGSFAEARVGLAMRRLSVIGVDNGHQPIFNEEGDVVLIFNGEIYNYAAIKTDLEARGHRFSTATDAEVLVHLYEDRGDRLVDDLRGMFAFAVYDRRRERLVLGRDRSGQKPLYYAVHDDLLVFGSEIKALNAFGLMPKELDLGSLCSYLTYGFVVGERTLFAGIRKLAPGHVLTARPGGRVDTRQYWDLPASNGSAPSLDEAASRVRDLLEEGVRKRLMSEVPLGAFLSGGVDSSAIVALMTRHLDEPFQTFCVGFEDGGVDELPHAREVAEHFGTRHYELLLRGCNLGLLGDLNWHHDEPAGDPAAVPTFCLSHFARKRITVALTGEGGDETFAGYTHHRHSLKFGQAEARLPWLSSVARAVGPFERILGSVGSARFWKGLWIAGLPLEERLRGWFAIYTDLELTGLLRPELHEASHGGALAQPFRNLHAKMGDRDLLDQLLYVDSKFNLAEQLLMKVDKTTMAASLEARCPFLDQELVEYAAALPPSLKLSAAGGSKVVLRRALRGLVSDDILERPKHGFDVPLATWLLRDLEPQVTAGLLSERSPLGRYLDLEAVRGLWHRFRKRRDTRFCKQIWRLLNLAVWHEIHWPTGLWPELAEAGTRDPERDPAAGLFVERAV